MTQSPTAPNIDLNPHDWEEVKRILRTYVPEYEVWAFGSRVKWTAKAYSDLDLVIISKQPLSLSAIANLKDAFDESTLAIKVDVVDWATTSESFRKIIESSRIVIQKASTATESWSYKKLIDCTRDGALSYGIVQPGQHVQDGIPIVRVNNFNNGRLQCEDVMRVSPDIEKKYKRTRLEGGEVLLTLVGSTGQSAVVPKEMAGWNIARAVAVIRPKPDIGANWINICLQTKDVQQFLNERANTTVQKTLNLGDVRELPIPIPPKGVKEQIEAIYMALTNKIELSRQINQTLERIAQTIFKSWFVDFEPVKAKIEAKAEGRDPERAAMCAISGKIDAELDKLPAEQRQQLAATAALFPDELVESELGLIPEGWEVGTLQDLLVLQRGFDLPAADRIQGSFPIIAASGPAGYHEKPIVKAPGIVTGRSGVLGKVFLVLEDYWPLNTSLWVKEFKKASPLYAYHLLKKLDFTIFNAGSAVPTLNRNHVHGTRQLLPSDKCVMAFELKARLMYEAIRGHEKESETLATLRDTLLPKLLTGELSLKNLPLEATT